MLRGKKENLYNHQNEQTFLVMCGNKQNKMVTSPCTFTDICCCSKIEGARNIKLICSMLRIDYKGVPAGEQNHSTAGCYGCESISSFLINTGVQSTQQVAAFMNMRDIQAWEDKTKWLFMLHNIELNRLHEVCIDRKHA